MRNGKIWLSKNIKLDKDYRAVLNFTETNMINLMSDNNNLVYYDNKYSFIRETGEIVIGCKYNIAIQANYMAFQNPDYSNKVFFAFIDEVIYTSEKATTIRYSIDVWTTWYEYWNSKACFVIREHVRDDSRGIHTVPENLETGEYMCDFSTNYSLGSSHVVMSTTISPYDGTTPVGGLDYGGIYSGTAYYVFKNLADLTNALTRIATSGNSNSINAIFYCPDWVTGYDESGSDIQEVSTRQYQSRTFSLPLIFNSISGDYTPKNNKLFTFPYCYYLLSNNSGDSRILHLEDFLDDGSHIGHINCYGTCCVGGSIRAIPENYKKFNSPTATINDSNEYGINFGKFPVASFPCDAYTNYLTQNSVNFGLSVMSGTADLLLGNISGGANTIVDNIASIYNHHFNPIEARGNVNSGDVTYATGKLQISTYLMTIKKEYAKIIDDFFTRQGYKVNTIKVPNMSHRQNYNYVQISSDDNVAYVNNHNGICPPSKDIDMINKLFRRGITIWNNHTNLGDYSVSNNITN